MLRTARTLRIRLTATATATAAAVAAAPAAPAHAQSLVHAYELNGSFDDTFGGPAMSGNAAGLGATGYTFGYDQGPSLVGAVNADRYSIEMYFRINDVASYRSLINFKNQTTDNGLYDYSGALALYQGGQVVTKPGQFANNTLAHLVVTRTSADVFTAYVNGILAFSFADALGTTEFSIANRPMWLLNDNRGEEPAGFLDFVRIYDGALSQQQVTDRYQATIAPTSTVPEPGTWALLGTGLALLGGVARRRRAR